MIYLGKYGSLVQIPSPRRGLDVTFARSGSVKNTIGGGRVVDFAPGGRRIYTANWATLGYDSYAVLEEFYLGHRGPGPWVLLDTARRNHLTINQSSATSQSADPTGFTVDTGQGEWVSSTADAYLRGPRSLRWTLPATVTTGILTLDPPAGLFGVPSPAGVTWTLSGSLSLTGVAPSVTVTPVLSWRRIDGSEVSITSGTPVVATPAAWTAFFVTGAPPAGAVGFVAQLRVAPGVLTTAALQLGVPTEMGVPSPRPVSVHVGSALGRGPGTAATRRPAAPTVVLQRAPISTTDVLLDKPQLDMSATVRPWAPGTGVPQVSWLQTSDVQTYVTERMPVDAVLVEVG